MNFRATAIWKLPRQFAVLTACLLFLQSCASLEKLAIPESKLLFPELIGNKSVNLATINHNAWDQFLETYVSQDSGGVNRLAYAKVTAADRQALYSYLNTLTSADPRRLSRQDQLAYWVNLYNAQTVALILENYPVKSIRQIKSGALSVGPWSEKLLSVNGESLSLHDIEHSIIRPGWNDPRIHYVINCAAVGCPNLAAKAYTGETIDWRMTEAAIEYINNARGVQFDDGGGMVVSKIYLWFEEDFGGSKSAVIDHIRTFAGAELKERLPAKIAGYEYDWSLNE